MCSCHVYSVAGYQKLAAATCNTLFWAGDRFAWKRKAPDGRGLSTFLQDSMCDAFAELAKKLDGCEAVLGFEVSGSTAYWGNDSRIANSTGSP